MLDHPKIIKLISYYFVDNDQIALLLEYAIGGTLKKYLAEKEKLEEEETKNIISQILDALSYCHSKDLIHRDMKLENIMYIDNQRTSIKLIDFGISGIVSEAINAGSIKYLPPEVINGDLECKPGVDTWAVGCITYELLSGKKLFCGDNIEAIKVSYLNNKLYRKK